MGFHFGAYRGSRSAPIHRLGLEWAPDPGATLTLTTYPGGRAVLLALADPHGAWIIPKDDLVTA